MQLRKATNKLVQFTRNVQDAEDAVQNAALELTKCNLDAKYLTAKAIQEYSDYRRLKKNAPTFNSPAYIDQIPCLSDLETATLAKEEVAQIMVSLPPPKQRLLIILLHFGGSATDASQATGITLSKFKSLMYNIRHDLEKEG